MSTVRLSKKNAAAVAAHLEKLPALYPALAGALRQLRDGLSPRQLKPIQKKSRQQKITKKLTKRARRSDVREQVMARAKAAGNLCECGCGKHLDESSFLFAPTMDHFFGKARAESVETCWALTARCHDAKSYNVPSAEDWRSRFIKHCELYGYAAAAERARTLNDRDDLVEQAAEASRG